MRISIGLIILLHLVCLGISAQESHDNVKNGKSVTYYENGQQKEEIQWKDGQKHGTWTQWFKDGKKRRETHLKNGVYDGKDTRWYANGKLRSQETYREGKKHGQWLSWFENAKKRSQGQYQDDLKQGQWTYWNPKEKKFAAGEFTEGTGKLDYWYDNGGLKKHEEHFQGKAHGTWSEGFPNGNKKFEIQYQMGSLQGTFTRWYENGRKMRETQIKDGTLHGTDTHWYENGKKDFQREYKQGKRHGKWQAWYQSGKKKGQGEFADGTGTYQEFYESGSIKSEEHHKQGNPHGTHCEWYENGKKRSEQSWKDGKRDGKWTWWDSSGTITMEQTWQENRLHKHYEPPSSSQPPKRPSPQAKPAVPQKLLNETLEETIKKIVQLQTNLKLDISVMVGIIHKGQQHVFSYGRKSAHDKAAPDGDTVFEIGSISKTFTATILADMYLKGYMDLHDPVQKFLPVNATLPRYNGESITLYHLATHISSLPSMADNLGDHILDPGDPYVYYSQYDMYDFFSRCTLEHPIGSKVEYSNFGIGLLGHVLGRINLTTYEELLKERLLEVLGMHNTTLFLTDKQKANLAPGHKQDGSVTPNWNFSDCLQGAGAIKSSMHDMLKYMAANMGLVNTPLQEAMETTHEPLVKTQWGDYNGLGWGIETLSDGQVITWHNGGTGGYRAFLGFNKELKQGVIVLSNFRSTNMDAIGRQVLRLLKAD